MYGVFVGGRRPASKKAVKEAVRDDAGSVYLEGTSMFGNEVSGRVPTLPDGTYTFVGPDPFTSRKFYGNLVVQAGKFTVK